MSYAAFGSDLIMPTELVVPNRGTPGSVFIYACKIYLLEEVF